MLAFCGFCGQMPTNFCLRPLTNPVSRDGNLRLVSITLCGGRPLKLTTSVLYSINPTKQECSEDSGPHVSRSESISMAATILVAKSAGFCFGVRDAITTALDTQKQADGDVYMLGHIVHNEHVVQEIAEAGVKVVDSVSEIPEDATLLVRAHGTVPETYQQAADRKLDVVDATCPLVHEIHEEATELEEQGYRMVVIGDHGHDEVVGIAGHLKDPTIIATPEEVAEKIPQTRLKRIGVVSQSTQNITNVQAIISKLTAKSQELRFINTICGPTYQHQRDIRKLPQQVDVMIIVGSFTSANTCRLTSISQELNPRSYQVQASEDLQSEWFDGTETIGVHAGASTPDSVIDDVVTSIQTITGATLAES